MKQDPTSKHVHAAVSDGWVHGGSFLGSVLAGTFLGLLADHWLGTDPWLVAIGAIAGFYSGFMQMWKYSEKMEDPRGR